jgi:hypothetical protein
MAPGRRPSFTRDFPRTPELDALVDAFSRGDYANVRANAPALLHEGADEGVQRAARTLAERTRPDPLVVALLAVTAVLLLVVAAWAIAGGRHVP